MTLPPKPLAGGNPRIAKGDGDAVVQTYIAAMPDWKRAVGEHLDTLITRTIPGVQKAIKWNTPFYGVEGLGFFVAFHVYTRYVKVAFFNGAELRPMPPGVSKTDSTRYLDIHEGDALDDTQLIGWFEQASSLPGFMAPKI